MLAKLSIASQIWPDLCRDISVVSSKNFICTAWKLYYIFKKYSARDSFTHQEAENAWVRTETAESDALMLKHLTICIHSADWIFDVLN